MMLSFERIKKYCKDDITMIENYELAINDEKLWDCHHKLEIQGDKRFSRKDLIALNLYYERPASELILLTHSEHTKLHKKGVSVIHSEEHKKKISEWMKGRYVGEKNPMFGKKRPDVSERNKRNSGKNSPWFGRKHSEETILKMKAAAQLRIARKRDQ